SRSARRPLSTPGLPTLTAQPYRGSLGTSAPQVLMPESRSACRESEMCAENFRNIILTFRFSPRREARCNDRGEAGWERNLMATTPTPTRPPLPPFTRESAIQKVRLAEDGWNSRDPGKVALAYAIDSRWRNRSEFINGRNEIIAFLSRKW